jgi:isovaleryl-CoA dehydrogenase
MNASFSMLDHGLGEEIDMLRNFTYKFSQAEIAPRAQEIDSNNEFPNDLWKKMGALGLLGVTIAEEYGGSNMGFLRCPLQSLHESNSQEWFPRTKTDLLTQAL